MRSLTTHGWMYLHCSRDDTSSTANRLKHCIADVYQWMSTNRLDQESAATLVQLHVFVISRVDYCNTLLASAPKVTTDKLQRVLSAATRILTGTHKFDGGLSWLLHTELHWLNMPEEVAYKLGVIMFSCQHSRAP